MPETSISIDGLSHCYGQHLALNNLSLSVNPGEIFGLLGPNGSGKTTLFRLLSTLIPIQRGSVNMLGLDLANQKMELRKQIGVVFQSPSLDKQLTAEENLRHQGHLYGLQGAELNARIQTMLGQMGLSKLCTDRRRFTGTLSGGQRRRVEIAKGLLHRPRLLLLDEPSTGLDPGARIDLWRYLRQIRDQHGVTILMTTHLMEEADLCDRLGIMTAGSLMASDTPDALKSKIGGDVITIATPDLAGLQTGIATRFQLEVKRVDDRLRLERANGHELIPLIVEAFPGKVTSVSLGKPTLEDVFIQFTGKRFVDE